MANERNTENLVRDLLRESGYLSNENILVEEQSSKNPKIDKLLLNASKKGNGKGYPEFIITFANRPYDLIVIECKAAVEKHESDNKKKYADFAVDGALNYAAYLKDSFNVMAMAISGETKQEMKISSFLWIKGKQTYKETSDKSLLNPTSLFKVIDKKSAPIREDELIKKAIIYNEILHKLSVPEVDRCKLISAILVALQDKAFATGYSEYFSDDHDIDYNPNIDLVDGLIDACKRILKKNKITGSKSEVILREYEGIKQVNAFVSKTHTDNKVKVPNRVLRNLIDDLSQNVMPYVNNDVFDVLGQFYTQFIRYAGSDSKTGLVLTPPHITDLFCDLAGLTKDDIIFDPCCGTGGFLVSAMKQMIDKAGNDNKIHKRIKSNQLIGIEQRADMFAHACSNMMMRGDGKSHIHYGSCFDNNILKLIKEKKPTASFLNPPYDGGPDEQLNFIENAMNVIVKDGVCIAICQMSVAVGSKKETMNARERLLTKHTLEAVLSVPDELFYPVAANTCILVLKAHTPHPKNKKTFFGYFKYDGFTKVKHKGRIDQFEKWEGIKKDWLSCYTNRETIVGLSTTQSVDANNEWCAEAYIETEYKNITSSIFEKHIRKLSAFQFLTGRLSEIVDRRVHEGQYNLPSIEKWLPFRYDKIFSIKKGYYNKKPSHSIEGKLPFIGATERNNGVTSWHDIADVEARDKTGKLDNKIDGKLFEAGCITISNNGSVGFAFYQPVPFTCTHDVNPIYFKNDIKINPYIAMFLCAIIELDRYRWGYGRKWRPKRMPSSIIKLPVNKKGEPDWQLIEDYIKSLPYSSNLEIMSNK